MSLSKNDIVSHYRILEEIGRGGMGEVYLAEDKNLGRKVAIKMLSDECCDDDERLVRFVREAKTASALNHPNIITIFEFGTHEGSHYIATEFIEGSELRDLLETRQLGLHEALDLAIQIGSALAAAHAAGVVHRDIKPANIMLRGDGIVKVLDFGLAKLNRNTAQPQSISIGEEDNTLISPLEEKATPTNDNPDETQPGVVMGTPRYMSPEQARGHSTDSQTDVFSFGVLLYEMLSGERPFQGETINDVIASVIAREPKSLCEFDNRIPPELEAIVSKALNKDKAQRFPDAGVMLGELSEIRRTLEAEEHLEKTGKFDRAIHLTEDTATDRIEDESIAVLPFSNMSVEERSDYFSEGLSEEIIVNLSKLKTLRVVPRGSTPDSGFEGKSHQEIAELLKVRYLLEGSVRRSADNIRISAQLIDATEQSYLWSESYSGTISDVFEIQENVATEIVTALELTLSPDEEQDLKKRYTENTAAYQLYLQGRFFWNKRSIDGLNNAIRHFELAIESDPDYALAWAGIADSYSLLAEFGTIPHKEIYPKAEEAVRKALELDDELAEVHTSYASLLLFNQWDWTNSEIEFKRALELNPNYATAYHWYSFWFLAMGELQDAKKSISKAAELDPVSQAIVKDKGMVAYYNREYDVAVRLAETTLALDPQYPAAHRLLSLCYLAMGEIENSIKENQIWRDLTNNFQEGEFCLAYIYAVAGDKVRALKIIENLGEKQNEFDNMFRGLALVYTALGDFDSAFKMLDRSFEVEEIALLSIQSDPKVEPLRDDPRFMAFLQKLGVA